MGSSKLEAIEAAKQLNSILMVSNNLVDNVLGYVSVSDHIDWMRENILPEREYSKSTMSIIDTRFRNLTSSFGSKNIAEITVQDIASLLENNSPSVSNQLRQVCVDIFNIAISRGLCRENPAEYTLKKKQKTVRKRLTEDEFAVIHKNSPIWLQNAMDLAYITLQRRSDIVQIRFSDIKSKHLFVIQHKTKKHDTAYIKIEVSEPLARLIKRCQDSTISPFVIHRKPKRIIKRDGLDHWTQIAPDYLSRIFKQVRDSLVEFKEVPMSERPTFHEIRALGIKKMKDAGMNPQQLAGHASEGMTKNYDSGHDSIRWTEAVASLDLIDKTSR
jgi:integrase